MDPGGGRGSPSWCPRKAQPLRRRPGSAFQAPRRRPGHSPFRSRPRTREPVPTASSCPRRGRALRTGMVRGGRRRQGSGCKTEGDLRRPPLPPRCAPLPAQRAQGGRVLRGHDHSRPQPGMREGGPLGVLAEGGVTPSSILPAGRALLTPRLPREAALGANPCALRAGAGETQARAVGMRTGPSAARRAAAPARGDRAPTRGDPRPLSWSNNLLLEMLSPELIGACAAPPTPATLGTFQCPNAPPPGVPLGVLVYLPKWGRSGALITSSMRRRTSPVSPASGG